MEQITATLINALVPIVVALAASSGMWSYLAKKSDKKDMTSDMLVGLGHDRIMFLGMKYVDRGYITADEFENLNTYLYEPYVKLGGNGSVKLVMEKVKKLEVRK